MDNSRTKQVLDHLNERLNPGAPNQVSAPPSQNSERTCAPTQQKTFVEATSTLSHSVLANHCKRGTRWLVPKCISDDELKAKGSIFMCMAFDNVKHAIANAHRLIQERAFIHGIHCRVSPYRHMSRSRI